MSFVDQRVSIRANPGPRGQRSPAAVVQGVVFDRLQKAQINIQARWPIDTGRSFSAWTVTSGGVSGRGGGAFAGRAQLERSLRASLLRRVLTAVGFGFSLRNDARDKRGEYSGFVHRTGQKGRVIADDDTHAGGVPFEVHAAEKSINAALGGRGKPEEDPTFGINRLAVARLTQALARANVLGTTSGATAVL